MRYYQLDSRIYLERFGAEALLLVADRDLLLTVNSTAADLFEAVFADFAGRPFTRTEGCRWLGQQYELSPEACRIETRKLLVFGLRHRLVRLVKSAAVARKEVDVNE